MLTVRIVIPCYTEERWDLILRVVQSAREQTYSVGVTLVVDHNYSLEQRLSEQFGEHVTILANKYSQGVSGARNTGAFAADTDLVAFLDDDAVADPRWIENVVSAYESHPRAAGVGGAVVPLDGLGLAPWFPDEFLWVVGVTPPGRSMCIVRNVWGSNMLVSRARFTAVGGFRDDFGKVGHISQPEDTELCIRMTAESGSDVGWVFVPDAVVAHAVHLERTTWSYFVRRCWLEGTGKFSLAAHTGKGRQSLGEESSFVRTILTQTLLRNLAAGLWGRPVGRGRAAEFGQAAAVLVGTAVAGAAYLVAGARRPSRVGARGATP